MLTPMIPPPPLFTTDEHDAFAARFVFLASIFAIVAVYFLGADPT